MKKLLIISILAILSGCAVCDDLCREDVQYKKRLIEREREGCRVPWYWDDWAQKCRDPWRTVI
jgi:hypothetical protein